MDTAVVVDASVWTSWLLPQDVFHQASHAWMDRYARAGGLLITPALLLIEVAAAVARRTGQSVLGHQAVQTVFRLHLLRLARLDPSLIISAARIAADRQLRAGDATYVAVAQHLSIPLVTWDNEQLLRSMPLIRAYTPATYSF